ncbi:MAG: hypothetical protein J6R34_04495 [Clostridia bacterium]|nr:hypothetical protein [Clostridia bacterium]MBO7222478.1 hypothetical protein [Clostridia bacterium]MBR5173640.1 hypothetical protein [Clostridia bacterium]
MEVIDERKTGIAERLKNQPILKKLLAIKNLKIMVIAIIIALGLIIYSDVSTNESGVVSNMDQEEIRLASTLSQIEGVGEVQTMITRNGDKISGVLVIAEGAENISVMLKLLDATATVMGVDKSIVEVYQME